MLIMRACLQTSVISFAVDVWSRHATGGENALRDEIKQLKTMIAKKKRIAKKKKGKPLYRPKWPMWRALNSGFLSMKRLGGLLLPPGWDAYPSQGYPQHIYWYPFVQLGEEKHCASKVSCPRTQHKDLGQGSNPDHSIRSRAH